MSTSSYNKEYYLKNRERIISNRKYREQLDPERAKLLRKQWDIKYYSNERNFLRDSWSRAKKRSRNNNLSFNLRFETLQKLWEEHKQKYGYSCRYTGIPMTFIRGTGTVTSTNLSLDRLDPKKEYEKGNIVFCTIEFNTKKSNITDEDCKKILKVYEESRSKAFK